MIDSGFAESLKKARNYGLGEFLEIIGELSQESTKKGMIDRKHKELTTLGIALSKGCHRCIDIHHDAAQRLGASDCELQQVRKIALYTQASPEHRNETLWHAWADSWREFSLSKGSIERRYRELIGLGIALVQQDARLIDLHTHAALEAGASANEIFEVMPIALLMDGAPALSQIPQLVQAVDAFNPETRVAA